MSTLVSIVRRSVQRIMIYPSCPTTRAFMIYYTYPAVFQFFKDFEIPTEYEYLWRYLENAYNTEGMHQSTPADREIIRHYEGKATGGRRKQTHASLMKDARTFSVPTATGSAVVANGGASSSNGDDAGAAGDADKRHSSASSEPEVAPQHHEDAVVEQEAPVTATEQQQQHEEKESVVSNDVDSGTEDHEKGAAHQADDDVSGAGDSTPQRQESVEGEAAHNGE